MISLENSIGPCQIYRGGALPAAEMPASGAPETTPSGPAPPSEHTVCDPRPRRPPDQPPPGNSWTLHLCSSAVRPRRGGGRVDPPWRSQRVQETPGWHGRRAGGRAWFWFSSYTNIL